MTSLRSASSPSRCRMCRSIHILGAEDERGEHRILDPSSWRVSGLIVLS